MKAGSSRKSPTSPQAPIAAGEEAPDKRARLLAASAELFAEFGFEATSMRQIADKVDLLSGSLYHYVDSKEELMHAIIRDPLFGIIRDSERVAAMSIGAEEKLICIIIMKMKTYVLDFATHAAIQKNMPFFARNADFSYVDGIKQRSFQASVAIVTEGIASGLFRPDVDVPRFVAMFFQMVSSAAIWFKSGDIHSTAKVTSYSLEQVIDFHLDSILRVIRTPARLEEPFSRQDCERLLLEP